MEHEHDDVLSMPGDGAELGDLLDAVMAAHEAMAMHEEMMGAAPIVDELIERSAQLFDQDPPVPDEVITRSLARGLLKVDERKRLLTLCLLLTREINRKRRPRLPADHPLAPRR